MMGEATSGLHGLRVLGFYGCRARVEGLGITDLGWRLWGYQEGYQEFGLRKEALSKLLSTESAPVGWVALGWGVQYCAEGIP